MLPILHICHPCNLYRSANGYVCLEPPFLPEKKTDLQQQYLSNKEKRDLIPWVFPFSTQKPQIKKANSFSRIKFELAIH